MNNIAATQTCAITNIKELKRPVEARHIDPRLVGPPVPAVSALAPVVSRPVPSPAPCHRHPDLPALQAAPPAPLELSALQTRPYAEVAAPGQVGPKKFINQARESSLVPAGFLTAQFLQKLKFMKPLL